MTARVVVGDGLVLLGVALIGVAAVGLIRLPDPYHRASAVAKAAALGVCLVLAGCAVLNPRPGTVVTLVIAVAAQLFSAPISGYAVGRAAYRSGARLVPGTRRDDRPD